MVDPSTGVVVALEDNPTGPEGHQPPREQGPVAFSRVAAECKCGRWEFRDIAVTTDLAALERWCPRCESKVLLVFRRSDHLATVWLRSNRTRHIRRSLSSSGLSDVEVELLMEVVGEMGP